MNIGLLHGCLIYFAIVSNSVFGCQQENIVTPSIGVYSYIESHPQFDGSENYESNTNVCWRFIPLSGYSVEFIVDHFSLEEETSCIYDYLSVSTEYHGEIGKFCGNEAPPPISFTSCNVTLQFISDLSMESTGFRIRYRYMETNNTSSFCTYEEIVIVDATTASPNNTNKSKTDDGLSTWEAAGIAFGVVTFLVIVFFLWRQHRAKNIREAEERNAALQKEKKEREKRERDERLQREREESNRLSSSYRTQNRTHNSERSNQSPSIRRNSRINPIIYQKPFALPPILHDNTPPSNAAPPSYYDVMRDQSTYNIP